MTLEERLRRAEDMLELQQLQGCYCRLADRGWGAAGADSRAVSELFTEDGVWSSPQSGSHYEGRQAIAEGLGRSSMAFTMHMSLNPEFEIDGDEAKGAWRAIIPMTTQQGQALLAGIAYHMEYRRTPEGWRIRRLRTESAFTRPFDGPWAPPPAK